MDKFWLLLWASVSELSYSLYISIEYNMFLCVAQLLSVRNIAYFYTQHSFFINKYTQYTYIPNNISLLCDMYPGQTCTPSIHLCYHGTSMFFIRMFPRSLYLHVLSHALYTISYFHVCSFCECPIIWRFYEDNDPTEQISSLCDIIQTVIKVVNYLQDTYDRYI